MPPLPLRARGQPGPQQPSQAQPPSASQSQWSNITTSGGRTQRRTLRRAQDAEDRTYLTEEELLQQAMEKVLEDPAFEGALSEAVNGSELGASSTGSVRPTTTPPAARS
jgi:hypothetical protein